MKKSSIALFCTLLASTTFIVNCQKAPNKRGVRAQTSDKAAVATDAKAATLKACDDRVLKILESLHKKADYDKKTQLTDETKQQVKDNELAIKAECDEILPLINREEGKGCLNEKATEEKNKIVMADKIQKNLCNAVGTKLEKNHGVINPYAAQDRETKRAETESAKVEKLTAQELTLSEEGRNLTKAENVNWESILVNGKVAKASELKAALAAKAIVCSFLDTGADLSDSDKVVLKITEKVAAEKASLPKDVSATATSFSLVRNSTHTPLNLVCLNLDAKNLTAEKIKQAFGSTLVFSEAPVKVNPNQATDSAIEQADLEKTTAAQAASDKKAADEKAAASSTAVVTLLPAVEKKIVSETVKTATKELTPVKEMTEDELLEGLE